MSDRGMKKWNAYKTLEDHMPSVEKTMQNRYKVNKPQISSEEAEIINYKMDLSSLTQGNGKFAREFFQYEEVPFNIQEKIVKERAEENK